MIKQPAFEGLDYCRYCRSRWRTLAPACLRVADTLTQTGSCTPVWRSWIWTSPGGQGHRVCPEDSWTWRTRVPSPDTWGTCMSRQVPRPQTHVTFRSPSNCLTPPRGSATETRTSTWWSPRHAECGTCRVWTWAWGAAPAASLPRPQPTEYSSRWWGGREAITINKEAAAALLTL